MKSLLLLMFTFCTLSAQEDIKTLSQLQDRRIKVSGPYIHAARAIFSKAEKATDGEKAAFIKAATDLKELQAYVCPSYGTRFRINIDSAGFEQNQIKLDGFCKIMEEAKIQTSLPATRAQLNEGQRFLDALYQALQLPVVFSP
jgi:hypothetical protein